MNAAAPTLPADLAALLDATGELRLTHPTTGAAIRLVPTPAFYDDGRTDLEAIREGVAEADAGLFVTDEEIHAAMTADFPFLRDAAAPDGGDPADGSGAGRETAG